MVIDPANGATTNGGAEGHTTWNYRTMLGQGTFGELSFNLSSPGMVLPFLYTAVSAPIAFAGLILPVYRAANLLAGLVSAPVIGASARRKWFVVFNLAISALALMTIALATTKVTIVLVVAVFLAGALVIGLGGGVENVAYQDLLGRTLPENRRRNLVYVQAGLAAVLTIAVALISQRALGDASPLERHLELLWIGIAATICACALTAIIREAPQIAAPPSEPHDGSGARVRLRDLPGQFREATRVTWFRRYLVAGALLLSVDLAIPFYAIHAATLHSSNHRSLGAFVIASSIGVIIGGLLWRRVSKVSVRAVFVLAAVTACLAGFLAIFVDLFQDVPQASLHSGVFLLISAAELGTYNARTLYIVGHTSDEERPYYLAVSNTVFGVMAVIIALAFGTLAHIQGAVWPIWIIIGLTMIAAVYAWRLRVETGGEQAPDAKPSA